MDNTEYKQIEIIFFYLKSMHRAKNQIDMNQTPAKIIAISLSLLTKQ